MAESSAPAEPASSSEVIANPKAERSESTSSCSSMVARKNAKNASEHAPLPGQKAPAQRMPWTNRTTAVAAIVAEDDSDDSEWESIEGEGADEEIDDEEEEEVMEDDSERVPPSECLFCGKQNDSVVANVAHMGEVHSFFIPDAGYLVDVEGLLTYLGYKLGVGRLCLWCSNERSAPYGSLQAVRQHMRDKGPYKMAQPKYGILLVPWRPSTQSSSGVFK
ncbi:cytoplasmic 60S subunit biogenesis factor ZNF622-like [Dermacentor andersoni]|uniref:cytoplasmic 60S subunit biogenesis factor ZNF622-like n=1 Tax=Dermacentor andersoni TaxID=34620 RepID=UPI002155B667